jgi:hypothetical protein
MTETEHIEFVVRTVIWSVVKPFLIVFGIYAVGRAFHPRLPSGSPLIEGNRDMRALPAMPQIAPSLDLMGDCPATRPETR